MAIGIVRQLGVRHDGSIHRVDRLTYFALALVTEGLFRNFYGSVAQLSAIPLLLNGGENLGLMLSRLGLAAGCLFTWLVIDEPKLGAYFARRD